MTDGLKKALGAIIVLLILLPVVSRLIPKPLTFEKIEAAFKAQGLTITNVTKATAPMNDAVEQFSMLVNGESVEIYRYDDAGKIAKQLEFQRPDSGQVIVESWHLAEALGAAKSKAKPSSADRNGMFMLTVTSEFKEFREQVMQIFRSL